MFAGMNRLSFLGWVRDGHLIISIFFFFFSGTVFYLTPSRCNGRQQWDFVGIWQVNQSTINLQSIMHKTECFAPSWNFLQALDTAKEQRRDLVACIIHGSVFAWYFGRVLSLLEGWKETKWVFRNQWRAFFQIEKVGFLQLAWKCTSKSSLISNKKLQRDK